MCCKKKKSQAERVCARNRMSTGSDIGSVLGMLCVKFYVSLHSALTMIGRIDTLIIFLLFFEPKSLPINVLNRLYLL